MVVESTAPRRDSALDFSPLFPLLCKVTSSIIYCFLRSRRSIMKTPFNKKLEILIVSFNSESVPLRLGL